MMIRLFKAFIALTLILSLPLSCNRNPSDGIPLPSTSQINAPENLEATALNSSSIRLTWEDKSPDSERRTLAESGFYIKRSTSREGEYRNVGEVGENVESFTDTGLSHSTTYYYTVMAFTEGTVSLVSNIAYATTLPNGPDGPDDPDDPDPPGYVNIQEGTAANERILDMAVDSSNNVYVTGYTLGDIAGNNGFGDSHKGGRDIFVIKYDTAGNPVWKRQLGSASDDEATGIALHGNYVWVTGGTNGTLVGQPQQNSLTDIFLLKLNASNGTLLATKQINSGVSKNDYAKDIVVSSDGIVYLTGYTQGNLPSKEGEGSAFVMKYSPDSDQILKTRQMGEDDGSNDDIGISIAALENNIYVAGHTNGSFFGTHRGERDVFFTKLNSDLEIITKKQFGTAHFDFVAGIAVTNDATIFIAGTTGIPQVSENIFVLRTDGTAEQEYIWKHDLNSGEYDAALGVFSDSAGNVYVAGETRGTLFANNSGYYDAFVLKYDSSGGEAKGIQFGTSYNDHAQNIVVNSSDKLIISGYTQGSLAGTNAGYEDIFVIYLNQSDLSNM